MVASVGGICNPDLHTVSSRSRLKIAPTADSIRYLLFASHLFSCSPIHLLCLWEGLVPRLPEPSPPAGDNPDRRLSRVVGHGKLDGYRDTGRGMLDSVQHPMTSIQNSVQRPMTKIQLPPT
jgi:hypothetical protein